MSRLKNLKDRPFFVELCNALSELDEIEKILRDKSDEEYSQTYESFENELDEIFDSILDGKTYTDDEKDEIRATFFAVDSFLSDVKADF